jgi:hypothetical protein
MAALRAIVLGASARVCEVVVVRSSLTGYDAPGMHGASIEEAAEALATLRGRVQAALAGAAEHLRRMYQLRDVGHFRACYGVSKSLGKPVARVTFVASAPLSTRERQSIVLCAVDYLREAILAASQVGETEIRVMA